MYSDPLLRYSWFPEAENLYLLHAHEVFYSFVFYQVISSFIAPVINKWMFGKNYTSITDKKTKVDFDIHTVSMVQCILSLILLAPVLFLPLSLNIVTFQDPFCSLVGALTIGYFVWDLFACIRYYNLYGIQFLVHALVSLYVFGLTLKPFCQTWIGKFLIFEASTPFVNINWYIIQLRKASPEGKSIVPMWFNVLNGVLLLVIFFVVRIVWGFSAIIILVREMWKVRDELPLFESFTSVSLNFVLDILNLLWFQKMIKIAIKMATTSKPHDT